VKKLIRSQRAFLTRYGNCSARPVTLIADQFFHRPSPRTFTPLGQIILLLTLVLTAIK
jgi:hypothetical protein